MAAENLIGVGPCCCGSVFFLLFGGALAYFGAQQYLLAQKIANTPTSKVRSVAAGLVELFGNVKCKDALSSPISKAKCVYWHINAEYYKTSKKHSDWHTFYAKTESKPFYLQDDTGKMLVEPKEAQITLEADFRSTGHMSDKALFGLLPQTALDKKVFEWLETDPAAKAAFNAHSGHNLRVHESYLAEDDKVFVLGSAEPIPGAASEHHEENLIVKKNNIDKIMFINDKEEKKFVGNMRLFAMIYLALGLLLLGGALLAMLGSLAGLV